MTFSELLRKEWGAVTFIVTVLLGALAVLTAFLVFHPGQAPVTTIPDQIASPSPASEARTATPTPSASASAAASPSPAPSASASP